MKTKPKSKIIINKTKSGGQKGPWRYSIIAANGETLVTSEGYTTKKDAERGSVHLTLSVLEITGDRFLDWARRHT